jgi:ubiquinol-cytochrome c reductase cytochrome b subunit
MLKGVGTWLESRLGLRAAIQSVMDHPVPKGIAGPAGWWYVFGSASVTLLVIQILTGIGLAMVYVPSADQAYQSLVFLNFEQPLGWFLRSLHYYAGSGMVVMVLAHMTQVYLHGSYKYPREMTWVLGVFLFVLTLGMFFTGQILRWDPDAYWGLAVAGSMAGRTPVIGPWVVEVVFGGPIIGGNALGRFFALHVFIIPGLLLLFLALHLWLVLKLGVSSPPVPGKKVDPKRYDAEYHEEMKTAGVPFGAEPIQKDILFSALTVIVVVVIAAILGPKGPDHPPDPTLSGANPRPEWPFLWLFGLLSISPEKAETFIMLVFPVILIIGLLLVPFISNRGERAPSRRPLAVLGVVVVYAALVALHYQGTVAWWSPQMSAWSGEPIPEKVILDKEGKPRLSPTELAGAAVFQNKSCRNCHALDGKGGQRGPDLTAVGMRLTRDQLIDQVSNGTPGGGNMPAYGNKISAAEMDALADFLVALRPADQPPARPANERRTSRR